MILVDAGPLAALVHKDDQHHENCVAAFRELREPLGTVWPALSEAMYVVGHLPQSQDALLTIFERGAVRLIPLNPADIPRIRELMHKYGDRPMDFADAALVTVAEREGIRTIFTVDRKDFSVYRLHGRGRFKIIP